MRVVVNNNSGDAIETPWPIRASIEDQGSQEFTGLDDGGGHVLKIAGYALSAPEGVTVNAFKGDPEVEYEAVKVGAVPILRLIEP